MHFIIETSSNGNAVSLVIEKHALFYATEHTSIPPKGMLFKIGDHFHFNHPPVYYFQQNVEKKFGFNDSKYIEIS